MDDAASVPLEPDAHSENRVGALAPDARSENRVGALAPDAHCENRVAALAPDAGAACLLDLTRVAVWDLRGSLDVHSRAFWT